MLVAGILYTAGVYFFITKETTPLLIMVGAYVIISGFFAFKAALSDSSASPVTIQTLPAWRLGDQGFQWGSSSSVNYTWDKILSIKLKVPRSIGSIRVDISLKKGGSSALLDLKADGGFEELDSLIQFSTAQDVPIEKEIIST